MSSSVGVEPMRFSLRGGTTASRSPSPGVNPYEAGRATPHLPQRSRRFRTMNGTTPGRRIPSLVFTSCRASGPLNQPGRADLHLHDLSDRTRKIPQRWPEGLITSTSAMNPLNMAITSSRTTATTGSRKHVGSMENPRHRRCWRSGIGIWSGHGPHGRRRTWSPCTRPATTPSPIWPNCSRSRGPRCTESLNATAPAPLTPNRPRLRLVTALLPTLARTGILPAHPGHAKRRYRLQDRS